MGEGSKEYGFEVWGGAPENPLSMGPERSRYATGYTRLNGVFCCKIQDPIVLLNAIFNFATMLLSFMSAINV